MKRYIREPFSALSHLLGAGFSVLALIVLIDRSGDNTLALVASAVFGISLILLYVASALTHGVHCSQQMVDRIERFDHAAIFLLIAGTYTPVCLLVIKGSLGWSFLAIEWSLAALGVYSIFANKNVPRHMRVIIYLAMGWLFLFGLGPIISAVPNSILFWLIGGGLFYTIGSIFFLTNRPTLWEGYFGAHDLWHVFVLSGSACHFIFLDGFLIALRP